MKVMIKSDIVFLNCWNIYTIKISVAWFNIDSLEYKKIIYVYVNI